MPVLSKLRLAALLPAFAMPTVAMSGTVHVNPRPVSQPAPAADPCIQCDVIYAQSQSPKFGDPHFWIIDPDGDPINGGASATWIGGMAFGTYHDIGISAARDLYGVNGEGSLQRLEACTFPAPGVQVSLLAGVALGGELTGPELYVATAPPLAFYNTVTDAEGFRGGFPTNWCNAGGGILTGDLAMSPDPANGLLYGTMTCASCPNGDTLVTISPLSGNIVAEIGCIQDALGTGYRDVFGLAFDGQCRLFGAGGPDESGQAFILEIDPATALATRINVTLSTLNWWGEPYSRANGLASLPCTPCITVEPEPPTCEPLTQGFWKRQCRGSHPSGESENLAGYAQCVSATRTFAGTATAAQICDELTPAPRNSKCEQARAQFMALMLNTCSDRLGRACCIDSTWTDATTVGEAIDEIDALLSGPAPTFDDCVLAQGIADDINTGNALCDEEPAPLP